MSTRTKILQQLEEIELISQNRNVTDDELEDILARVTQVANDTYSYTKKDPVEKMLMDAFRPDPRPVKRFFNEIGNSWAEGGDGV